MPAKRWAAPSQISASSRSRGTSRASVLCSTRTHYSERMFDSQAPRQWSGPGFRALGGASGFEEVAGVAGRFVVAGHPIVDVVLVALDEHDPAMIVVGGGELGVVDGGDL